MTRTESSVLLPPKEITQVGGGDFHLIGELFLRDFIELCALRPQDTVLDVGCGVGRIALPLTRYLDAVGGYEGLDIQPQAIRWCQQQITPNHPNFRFRLADIHNRAYNPSGRFKASTYRFPYPDERFDFACLTSVFTHLLPSDMENYLTEVARVLKRGGRCLITLYLAAPEAERTGHGDTTATLFPHGRGDYRLQNDIVPEAAVCFEEAYICRLYRENGLEIRRPLHYGSWRRDTVAAGGQDVIVATKLRAPPKRSRSTGQASAPEVSPSRMIRNYLRDIVRLRRSVQRVVPPAATVLVISRGDENLLKLKERRAWHFPQAPNGSYAGHHPTDSAEAIEHLEMLRARGAEYLVIPSASIWWLSHYRELERHLATHYARLSSPDDPWSIHALTNPVRPC